MTTDTTDTPRHVARLGDRSLFPDLEPPIYLHHGSIAPLSLNRLLVALGAVFVILIIVFILLVVYSKHLHIFLATANIALSNQPLALWALDNTPSMDLDELPLIFNAELEGVSGACENFFRVT